MTGSTYPAPSIGAANTELSRFVLEAQELINDITLQMQGKAILLGKDGKMYLTNLTSDGSPIFIDECTAYMKSKLMALINKNTILSTYSNPEEMYRDMKFTNRSFIAEAFYNMKQYKLTISQFEWMCNTYSDFISFTLRRALKSNTQGFLGTTITESTQRIDSKVQEEQKKSGLFGGIKLFGV